MTPGASIHDPQFDQRREHPGFRARRAWLGRQAGAERLGVSMWELPPGEAAYPYHWHCAEEEIAIVLEGRPSLRTPDGWRELEPGEVVAFPTGERGAHQIANRGEERVRFLALSTGDDPEVVVYPDSGKLGVHNGAGDGALQLRFRASDAVDYYDGERPPER